ncbi:MAG TPA: MiaB/RimO family radical SAM methylthiotransferase [bacterium]|nr:MiaB/RimO family radical SAM methylthiotransferase [bacterium]HOL49439.1 MiaB/RimO family radical SAM methylthiotransferase [bacterium]HPO51640.1 MiaB/RimO family radical SAM methylthiotransferase [bacterium]
MKKIKIFTFGCKANQYDSQIFREVLLRQGYETVNTSCDIVLINTCCVTKKAENEARKLVNKLLKNGKRVWVTGCWVEKDNLVSMFPEIKVVHREQLYQQAKIYGIKGIGNFHKHTRAFVKVVDGCENFCTYCIVPYVRGNIKSRQLSEIVEEIKTLVHNGFREIVLTGIDLGSYGRDNGSHLPELIQRISVIEGLTRFRLSSIEMFYIDGKLLNILSCCKNFCPSFHIPLQSGSSKILKEMGRSYTYQQYKNRIDEIRSVFPFAGFSTDIIVGFPGETEQDFEMSINAIVECGFLRVHVFPFSPHPQTPASHLLEILPEKTKKERVLKTIEKANVISREVKGSFVDKKCIVLIEQKIHKFWTGYTESYVPVLVHSEENLCGSLIEMYPQSIMKLNDTDYLYSDRYSILQ